MGDRPEVAAAQAIFWILLPIALFAPLRWSILAWLLMGNLDATGPTLEASAQIGWINAAKAIAIPALLWWRLRHQPGQVMTTLPARLWVALTIYATVGALWSPFPVAALKMDGNMVGIILMVVVLEKWGRAGMLTPRAVAILIVGSLALGVLQTYVYAGHAYGFDGADEPLRFTSFASAQQYAAYLVAFLAILLAPVRLTQTMRVVLLTAVCAALGLNGSRTWITGATLLILGYSLLAFRRVVAYVAFGAATMALGALLALNLARVDLDSFADTSGRVTATLSAVLAGQDTSQNAGLRNFNFRIAMYNTALSEIRTSSLPALVFGHGTSSGGTIATHAFPETYKLDRLDPNRAVHDEWLRALYEWGILGLFLFLGVFLVIAVGLVRSFHDRIWKLRAGAALAALPALLAALSTENVIAGAGNAVTMSVGLVIAILWAKDH